jgi:hypothetical protein
MQAILLAHLQEWDDACKRARELARRMRCQVCVDMYPSMECTPWVVWCEYSVENAHNAPDSAHHPLEVSDGVQWYRTTKKTLAILDTSHFTTVGETRIDPPAKTSR